MTACKQKLDNQKAFVHHMTRLINCVKNEVQLNNFEREPIVGLVGRCDHWIRFELLKDCSNFCLQITSLKIVSNW